VGRYEITVELCSETGYLLERWRPHPETGEPCRTDRGDGSDRWN
jgi:hypothetical protein